MDARSSAAALLHLAVLALARACTEVQMMAPGGELVVANSLEAGSFSAPLRLFTTLRGSKHGGHAEGCLAFEAKYGFVGGVSEMGLAVNEHALDLAVFQKPKPGVDSLCTIDFESWALGLHATVAELAASLPTLRVVGPNGGQWGVQDATGASVVVEYVKGVLALHNNSVGADNSGIGIMTNDPPWDWHLQNVNNYASLQPGWYGGDLNNARIQRKVPAEAAYPWATNAYDNEAPVLPAPIGHAYNLLGLPGDGSPPARFIRMFYMRGYAMLNNAPRDLNDTLVLGQELLNSVYKALGTVAKRSPADPAETVPISTLKVLSANVKLLFVRSRESMHWRRIDVSRIDFSAKSGAAPKSALVSRHQFEYTDVTDELL